MEDYAGQVRQDHNPIEVYGPSQERPMVKEHKLAEDIFKTYPEDKDYTLEEINRLEREARKLTPTTKKLDRAKSYLLSLSHDKKNTKFERRRLQRLIREGSDGQEKG